ncbi:MAG: hypothetical protein HFJ48_05100 [Clostridia bacterium]|nr:hypothetical protein [Clostridia bacterium]
MPGYVIHLAVANKYLETNYIENHQNFYKGVIAPDLTNDKTKTHYGNGSSETNLKEYLTKNQIVTSFDKGFFLHLITDYLFYNKYLKVFSKDIYNDYDILNKYLIEKYRVELPKEAKNEVFFKEGQLTLLDKESLVTFIDNVAKINLLEAEEEIKSDKPKGKWNTYTLKKL